MPGLAGTEAETIAIKVETITDLTNESHGVTPSLTLPVCFTISIQSTNHAVTCRKKTCWNDQSASNGIRKILF